MESLAFLVAMIVLALVTSPAVTLLLSLPDNKVTRILSYITGGLGIVAGLWFVTTVFSVGTIMVSLWVVLGNAGAIYYSYKRN